MVTGKKPVASGGGELCAHVVRVRLSWQPGVPWPGGLQPRQAAIRFLEVVVCSFLLYCNLKTLSALDLPQDEIGRAGNDIAHTFITTRS